MYTKIENAFDKLSQYAVRIFGNSITFILALILVLYWFGTADYEQQSLHDTVRDILIAITFLIFFIMQKSFNRLNTALHLKLNELVAAHENASNRLVNAEEKTETELKEIKEQHDHISKDEFQGGDPAGQK